MGSEDPSFDARRLQAERSTLLLALQRTCDRLRRGELEQRLEQIDRALAGRGASRSPLA